jgi:hypothetical protein
MKDLRKETEKKAQRQIHKLLRKHNNSPSAVARELGVNKGLVCRVRDGGYSPMICNALGLPVVQRVSMPICTGCGKVHDVKATCSHVRKRAPARRRKTADLNPTAWGIVQSKALDELAAGLDMTWSQFVAFTANMYIEGWPAEKLEREVRNAVVGKPPWET